MIKNRSGKSQGMAMAVLSTTYCEEIDMNQLELLRDRGRINNYEISADKTIITLYWTYLKKNEIKNVDLIMTKKFGFSKEDRCQRRPS